MTEAAVEAAAAARHSILLVEDDPVVSLGIASGLQEWGHDVIVCRDLESARLTLERKPVSYMLTDIKLSGPFRFEGLDLLDLARRCGPPVGVIVITGHATEELRREALARGALAVLAKPFSMEEIAPHLPLFAAHEESSVIVVPTLADVLTPSNLVPQFQPIVSLEHGTAVGFEALTRLRTGSFLADPEALFRYADLKDAVFDLEMAAMTQSLCGGAILAPLGFLSINVHPAVFRNGERFADSLFRIAERFRIPCARLVVEITEQGPLPPAVDAVVRSLSSAGVRFAFDDVGSAYSHLRFMAIIRPSFLKVSQHFGTDCESIAARRKIVEHVNALAQSFGSEVILEGVESQATAEFGRLAGIACGQGYFFGSPAAADGLAAALASNARRRTP